MNEQRVRELVRAEVRTELELDRIRRSDRRWEVVEDAGRIVWAVALVVAVGLVVFTVVYTVIVGGK